MLRFLPIVMVALGLILVSTSFAAAQPGAKAEQICVVGEDDAAPSSIKLDRCSKEVSIGILVPDCKVHGQICAMAAPFEVRAATGWPPIAGRLARKEPPPMLDLPPPKA